MFAYLIKETDILTFEAQRLNSYPSYPVQGKIYKQAFAQFAGFKGKTEDYFFKQQDSKTNVSLNKIYSI